MATGKFGRIGQYYADSVFKLESLESVDFGDIIVNYGTVSEGRVYIASGSGSKFDLCFVNAPNTRTLNISLTDSLYINGVEVKQTASSGVSYQTYDGVRAIFSAFYSFENGDYNFSAGNAPTFQRPVLVDYQPAIVDVSECYLHLLKNGNYVMLDRQVADNTEVYLLPATASGTPTITEISTFVGTYGRYNLYDFDVFEGEYSIRIAPELLEFHKNSGTHEIPWSTYYPEFIVDGTPVTISSGVTALISPDDSGLTSRLFPSPAALILDTDNNISNEFTLRFNIGSGLGTADSIIRVIGDEPSEPYAPAGPSGPDWVPGTGIPGGGPSGPGTGTLVPNGSNNPNVADGGTFTMYAANMGTLQGLGAWLYSSNFFDAVGRDIMSALWNSPIDGIISITAFPFGVPASANAPANIKFGNLEVPISLPVLQNSSMQINWGSVTITPTWNSFLDYAPHTKIELYLPFSTGFVTLDPSDVMGGTVSVVTNIDLIKGTCVHIVSSKYGVIGTYGGVCGLQIPVSGVDTAGKALNLLVSGVTTAVSAGAGALAGGTKIAAGITETNTTNRVLSGMQTSLDMSLKDAKEIAGRVGVSAAKPLLEASRKYNSIASRTAGVAGQTAIAAFRTPASVQRSGSFATNGGGLGPTTPFIIFSCPDVNIPANYGHFYGYPLNATMRIGDLKGYSEITGVHLNNVPALVPELDEISSLLEGGVIL